MCAARANVGELVRFGESVPECGCSSRHCVLCAAEQDGPGWWIVGLDCGPTGPYATRAEAQSDLSGLRRWYRENAKEEPRALFSKAGLPGQLGLFD